MERKRYVIVGTSGRGVMFLDALLGKFKEHGDLVGLCDLSQVRMDWYNLRGKEKHDAPPIPTYKAEDFERMIRERKPHAVIVTTMDCFHHEYICRAMKAGCDAISEKPMTTDAPKAREIFDTIKQTGKKLRVTFNYRYTPLTSLVRQLLVDGTVGRINAVDFSWVLDTSHGADYFRRWHREKDKSGGLLVHKATHHFDIINWWLDSYPKTVFAMGETKFYGRANAAARGKTFGYDRYTGHPEAKDDPFALFLDKPQPESGMSVGGLRGLYLNAEKETGYLRDRNVFGDNITAEDTMAVMARYRNGAILNYSLIAYSPWEGFRIAITGDKGRLEIFDKHGSHIIAGQSDEELAVAQARGQEKYVRVFPMFGVPRDVEIPTAVGAHGGGDPIMLRDIFDPGAPADPLKRAASHIDGAASILMGISANESIRTGMPVTCDDLVRLP